MVPEMGKMIALCRALGKNTYIHCTAGGSFARISPLSPPPPMHYQPGIHQPGLSICDAQGLRCPVLRAGINRASLATVTYLTWYCGMEVNEALALVREQRPQANPYMVSFEAARTRLLSGREQDVYIKVWPVGLSALIIPKVGIDLST